MEIRLPHLFFVLSQPKLSVHFKILFSLMLILSSMYCFWQNTTTYLPTYLPTYLTKMDYSIKSLLSSSYFIIKLLTFVFLFSTSCSLLAKSPFFTKLLMLRILFSTSGILLSPLSHVVLNNIIKFYKILWNYFHCVYITFSQFLDSTFSKYRCVNTSCSLNL